MADFLNSIFDQISPMTAYLVLFVSAFIENTFPPIPGDTVTVLGAYLIVHGGLNFWGVYISTTTGSILGFFTMYLIGLKFGRPFIKSKLAARWFNERRIRKTEQWFARYGYWVIAANRFLSGTRSVISLFAGFFHLRPIYVLLLASLSAVVWNGLLITAGYMLGVNWNSIMTIIRNYNRVVIVITVLVAIYIIYRRSQRKKRKAANQPNN